MNNEQLPEITITDESGIKRTAYMLHGDAARGIGYVGGDPVCISGGITQPGTLMSEKWQWGDGQGRYFSVNRRGLWVELTPGYGESSGWKLY